MLSRSLCFQGGPVEIMVSHPRANVGCEIKQQSPVTERSWCLSSVRPRPQLSLPNPTPAATPDATSGLTGIQPNKEVILVLPCSEPDNT